MGFLKTGITFKSLLIVAFFSIYDTQAQFQQKPKPIITEADTTISKADFNFYLSNPSSWIQAKMNKLSSLNMPQTEIIHIGSYKDKIEAIAFSGEMIKRNLANNSHSLRLRDVKEMEVELQSDISDLLKLLSKLEDYNNYLTKQTLDGIEIENEIKYFNNNADSSIKVIYQPEINLITKSLKETQDEFSKHLKAMVTVESTLNQLALQLSQSSREASALALKKEADFYKANLPVLWKSTPADYQNNLFITLQKTVTQIFETLEFFGSHSFIGLILFRIFLFLICMVPVRYYKKHAYNEVENGSSQYLHKYPALAPAIMGLAIAPLIFINPPFVFLDLLLISLTISTGIIYFKENRHLSLNAFVFILAYYIVLKLINFFVTPTFYGRIIYCSAIILIVPLHIIYTGLRNNNYARKNTAKIVYLILIIQLIAGCTLATMGYYSLGRMVLLSALDAFILLLILKISLFTFLDYLRLLANYLNSKIHSFSINSQMLEKLITPIIRTLAVLFFIVSYLKNINIYDNIIDAIDYTLNKSRVIGDSTFTISSILVFLISIFLAFYFSQFITRTIEPNENYQNDKKRNSVGSYMLLLRFALIFCGFLLGLNASGIPLTQFTVVMGALGVGIGFGLQNIFNNLVSGLIIAFEKPISVGDLIEVGEETGRVKSIGIRATVINTGEGADILIPNGKLLSVDLKNWTLSSPDKLAHLLITVANENDPELVQRLISETIEQQVSVIKKEKATVVLELIGNAGMQFHIRFWVREISSIERIKGEMMHQLYKAFKENNISYPNVPWN